MAEGGARHNRRLSRKQKDELIRLIGQGRKTFELLYRAKKDECSPDHFHRLCDGKGPTVTVLYKNEDIVFGGYTSKSWAETVNNYSPDSEAFLFKLKKGRNLNLFSEKFPCKDTNYAIFCDRNKAAVFGKSNDPRSGPITVNDPETFQFNGEINLGSYDMKNDKELAGFCNGPFEVTDISVYRVQDAPILDVSEEEVTVRGSEEEEDDSIAVEPITDSVEKMKISSPKEKGKDSAIDENKSPTRKVHFSKEETLELLKAYEKNNGDWSLVFECVKKCMKDSPDKARELYNNEEKYSRERLLKRLKENFGRLMSGVRDGDIRQLVLRIADKEKTKQTPKPKDSGDVLPDNKTSLEADKKPLQEVDPKKEPVTQRE